MDIEFFFAIVGANILANGLSVLYFHSLKRMDDANGKSPPWSAIIGGAIAPAIAAASIAFFVIG